MPPITATFLADFSDFYDGVQKADVSLKTFEQSAAKVGTALDRMGDNFSGRKLIQDATLMVAAVEKIGGVTKLTDAEFARLSNTVSEATAKMQAMGLAVPANMAAIATNVGTLNTRVNTLTGSMTGAAGAIGNFGVQLGTVDKALEVFGGVRLAGVAVALGELSGVLATTGASLTTFNAIALGLVGVGALGQLLVILPQVWAGLNKVGTILLEQAAQWGLFGKPLGESAVTLDTLARASDVAKTKITDLAEAEKILNDETKRMAEEDRKAVEEMRKVWDEARKQREDYDKAWDAWQERRKVLIQKQKENDAAAAIKAYQEGMALEKKFEDDMFEYHQYIAEKKAAADKAREDAHLAQLKTEAEAYIKEQAEMYTKYLTIIGTGESQRNPIGPALGGHGVTPFHPTDLEVNPWDVNNGGLTINQTINGNDLSADEIAALTLQKINESLSSTRRWPSQ